MKYNPTSDGYDPSLYVEASATPFCMMEVFGSDDEDVCFRDAPGFSPDELSADVLIYIRRDLPNQQRVECLLAATLRAEEETLR